MTRLAFERHLESTFEQGWADQSPLSLAIIRLDGFAGLIENEGLEAGDVAAIDVTESLQEACENLDHAKFGRFDDATVIVLCTSTLHRLTATIAQWRATYKGPRRQTTSAGLTGCTAETYGVFAKPRQLLAVAYRAMETAEKSGGNALRTFEPGNDKRAA